MWNNRRNILYSYSEYTCVILRFYSLCHLFREILVLCLFYILSVLNAISHIPSSYIYCGYNVWSCVTVLLNTSYKAIRFSLITPLNEQSRKTTYPLSSMRGTVLFRLLKAKQDFTRMPYVPETMHRFYNTFHPDCGRGLQEKLRKFHRKCEREWAIMYNRSSGGNNNNNNNVGKSMSTLVVCK